MRPHRFSPVPLLFGLLFLAIGVAFFGKAYGWQLDESWLWPAALILGGVIFLASAGRRTASAPAAAPEPAPTDAFDPDSEEPGGTVSP